VRTGVGVFEIKSENSRFSIEIKYLSKIVKPIKHFAFEIFFKNQYRGRKTAYLPALLVGKSDDARFPRDTGVVVIENRLIRK